MNIVNFMIMAMVMVLLMMKIIIIMKKCSKSKKLQLKSKMRINKCVDSGTISTIWVVQVVEPKLCVRVCACVWLMLIMTEIMVIMTMMIIIY